MTKLEVVTITIYTPDRWDWDGVCDARPVIIPIPYHFSVVRHGLPLHRV